MADKPRFGGVVRRVKLSDICSKGRSTLRQKDILNDGSYAVYGAPGIIGSMASFQNSSPYVAVIKDGAGVGRVSACDAKTSVLGTMQALIPSEDVERDYLFHLVRSLCLGEGFTGSTIPHIYFKDYAQTAVPLPDLAEQKGIVQRLNSIEEAAESAKAQISQLDSLIKSRFVEMFGDLSQYESRDLCDCVSSLETGKSLKCQAFRRMGSAPAVLKLSAISSGIYREAENKALPDDVKPVSTKMVCEGDILLARKNTPELVGRSALVGHTDGNIMFPDIVFRMHPCEGIYGVYLAYLLANPLFESVRALAHGSAKSMSNIPKSELARLGVPIAPLELQCAFAGFVSQVDKSRFIACFGWAVG